MSGRFILILVGVALVVPFFFLPRGIVGAVLLIVGAVVLLLSFAVVIRQLIDDACRAAYWIERRVRLALSGARTTPDRTGG
ncbi:MAG: hypothetical protein ISP45_10595 [Reyranella sp.]|jgi:hypothetical protein|nr:hypothetical protein [Reyranella sp.]